MHAIETIAPIILGSSAPIKLAVRYHGITKDKDATSVIGIMPFKDFNPCPQMQTIKKGDNAVNSI